MSELWDFGFTAVDEGELEALQTTNQQLANTSVELQDALDKLDKLYNAVQPLLNNLKANPSKEYIYWPDRLSKVEAFSDHLDNIYKN